MRDKKVRVNREKLGLIEKCLSTRAYSKILEDARRYQPTNQPPNQPLPDASIPFLNYSATNAGARQGVILAAYIPTLPPGPRSPVDCTRPQAVSVWACGRVQSTGLLGLGGNAGM